MKKIIIIGAGAMGSAFAFPCIDNNHDTQIIGTHLENEFIDKLKDKDNFHPALNLKIDKKIKIHKFEKFKKILNGDVDLIVLAVSSKGIEWAGKRLLEIFQKKIPNILLLTKGLSIYNDNYELLVDKLSRSLLSKGKIEFNISALGGPSLARGLANRVHTSVVLANNDIKKAKELSKLLNNHYYHVNVSDDLVGVEVSAAIKNIYSMAIGAAKGICKKNASGEIKEKDYLNSASALVNQAVYEMKIFVKFLKGKEETVNGLAGIGDLYVSSAGGRNSKMGSYLGDGMTYSFAKKNQMQNVTVEAADLAFEIGEKIKKDFQQKDLPLMISVINAITKDEKLNVKWDLFNYL